MYAPGPGVYNDVTSIDQGLIYISITIVTTFSYSKIKFKANHVAYPGQILKKGTVAVFASQAVSGCLALVAANCLGAQHGVKAVGVGAYTLV